jgi:hypothetical protein
VRNSSIRLRGEGVRAIAYKLPKGYCAKDSYPKVRRETVDSSATFSLSF